MNRTVDESLGTLELGHRESRCKTPLKCGFRDGIVALIFRNMVSLPIVLPIAQLVTTLNPEAVSMSKEDEDDLMSPALFWVARVPILIYILASNIILYGEKTDAGWSGERG